jgi:hypothetical protein
MIIFAKLFLLIQCKEKYFIRLMRELRKISLLFAGEILIRKVFYCCDKEI